MVWAACLPAAPQALRLLPPVAQPLLLQVDQQQQRLKAHAHPWREDPISATMSRGWGREQRSSNGKSPQAAPLVSVQDSGLQEPTL